MRGRVAVAVSGGRDSTALLHCAAGAARPLGLEVWALHVHHGLMPQADDWLKRLRRQARRWGLAFDSRRLSGAPAPSESVEAWARAGRYRALAEMAVAAGCDLVLLAHHRQDQAETWLLQALRGSGAAGLSAMPERAARQGIVWARPWLHQPRGAIDEYVRRHRLSSVEDPSNADARYARSRLRQSVWPALTAAFPDAEVALAAAAARAQEGAALADEVAAQDLPTLVQDKALCVAVWQALPPARRLNALRAWLRSTLDAAPPQTLLQRLQHELVTAGSGRWPAPGGQLRLHRGRLWAIPEAATLADGPTEPPPALLDLSQPGLYPLAGWGGHFATHAVGQGGVTPERLQALQPRPRQGGERLRLAPRATDRALKKQFQALGIPAWRREGPLLYTPDGHLLFVPGLGLNAEFWAKAGAPQLSVCWVSDESSAAGACRSVG